MVTFIRTIYIINEVSCIVGAALKMQPAPFKLKKLTGANETHRLLYGFGLWLSTTL